MLSPYHNYTLWYGQISGVFNLAIGMSKAEKVDSFKDWLIENDVEFTEHANGHFQIYNAGDKLMDVWATTEKARLVTQDSMVGFHVIKKTITAHRQ